MEIKSSHQHRSSHQSHSQPNLNNAEQTTSPLHKASRWASLIKLPLNLILAITNLLINIPVMNEVWRERKELAHMTLNQMRDAGLDPLEVKHEYDKGFFDIPAERRQSVNSIAELAQSLGLTNQKRKWPWLPSHDHHNNLKKTLVLTS